MGYLADLIEKAKSVLEVKPPTETRAIHSTSFDRGDWEKVRTSVPAIEQEIEEVGQNTDYVEDLFADMHSMFFKVDPQLRDGSEMAESRQANRAIVQQMLGMQEGGHLRQHSVGDTYGTAMSIVAVQEAAEKVAEQIREATSEAEQRAKEAAEQQQQNAEQIAELLAQMQQADDEEQAGALAPQLQQQIDQMQQAQQMQQQAQQEIQGLGQQVASGASQSIRSAAKDMDEQLTEEEDLARSFGVEPGELQRMGVQERIDLAKKLRNNRLAKFSKLLGAFKMVQQAESRKRVTNAATEVHGVTQSNDLSRMIAGEYLNFADKSLETLMLARWAEHQLNTYDVRGKERLGQGPVICVVDESGSMGATDVGGGATREAWSKALSLALLDQARRRKRDFIYIGFGSHHQQHVVRFPNGESDLSKIISMTEHFWSGGTHYETPLNMALQIIEEEFDRSDKGRPDIVFMTDDEYGEMSAAFMKEWNRIKDKASIQCFGIAIGCNIGTTLNQVSDNVRAITEMAGDPKHVGDLFRNI